MLPFHTNLSLKAMTGHMIALVVLSLSFLLTSGRASFAGEGGDDFATAFNMGSLPATGTGSVSNSGSLFFSGNTSDDFDDDRDSMKFAVTSLSNVNVTVTGSGVDTIFLLGSDDVTSYFFAFSTTANFNRQLPPGNYYVRVERFSTSGGASYSTTVSRTGSPAAPTALNLSNASVDENLPANTLIGNLTFTDPDPGIRDNSDSIVFSIVGGSSLFQINSSTNPDRLETSVPFNFEAQSSYNITLRATDEGGLFRDVPTTVTINNIVEATVIINPATLPNHTAGAAGYSETLTGSGGTAPYTFARTAGTLPTGLSLSTAGVLNGTPSAAGTFNFTITATDDDANPGSRAYSVTINPAVAITTATLPNHTVNRAGYSQTISASGGTGAKTFARTAGTLPTGLSLSTGGVLSGTPTAGGTFNFTVTATDTVGGADAQAYSVTINPAVSITTTTLAGHTVNRAGYAQTIVSTGGTGAKTFSVTAGVLPNGLALASDGDITGTPTAAGTSNFTVTATDTVGATDTQALSITINSAVVVGPASLPDWTRNHPGYSQTISATGGTGTKTLAVTTGSIPFGMTFTPATGVLAGTPANLGTSTFTITATDAVGSTDSQAYSITINPVLSIITTTLTDWTINRAGYSRTIMTQNGTGAATFAVTAGTLPGGLSLTSAGVISGTPTATGTFSFTVTATDSVGATAAQAYTVVINPPIVIDTTTLPDWTINRTGYSQTIATSGGTGAASFNISAGVQPTGLTLSTAGVLSGTPTATGTFNFTVRAMDGVGVTDTQAYTIVINPALAVTPTTLPSTTLNVAGYSQTLTITGGTGATALTQVTGTLPPGMSFTLATRALTGASFATGVFTFNVTATDAVGATVTQGITININPAVTVSPATLPNWTLNRAGYSQTIAAANGTGAKTLAVSSGAVPTGLTFTPATGQLSGTPTAAGTFNFTITATDSVGGTSSLAYTIVINPAVTVSPASLPDWTANHAGYNQTITSANGTGARTLAISTGSVPTGLTFTPATGILSGTPTAAGSFSFTITATDAVGATGSQAYTVVINAAIVVTPFTVPLHTVNHPGYSQTFAASNGTGAKTLAISGSIPPGLTFVPATGVLSGTPTAAGGYNFTVTATDTVGATASRPYTIIINDAITVGPASLPDWTLNRVGYSQTITASNGTLSKTLAVSAGALPPGMTLAAGVLSGTPTATGTFTFTVTATDTVGATGSRSYTIVINPAIVVSPETLPDWTENFAGYGQTIAATGGTGAKTLALTGTLPTGLSFMAGSGVLVGTPTAPGTFNFTITATDTVGAADAQTYTVTINPAIVLTTATLPDATINQPGYNASITATGGTGALMFTLTGGTLPAGLSLSTAGAISGTPTTAGTSTFMITATDTLGAIGAKSYSITINATLAITTTTLPDWTVSTAGYSTAIATAGGTGAISFAVTTGTAPTGLTLSPSGVLSGTPTTTGTFIFAVTATDIVSATATRTFTILINPAITLAPTTLPQPTAGRPYSQTVSVSGGTGVKTLSLKGALPPGLAFAAATGVIDGTPTISGAFNFTIDAIDTVGGTGSQSYTLVVNDNPAIAEGATVAVTLDEDSAPQPFVLTLNASDPENDALTWSISVPAANGDSDVSGAGSSKPITYIPDADFFGTDTFTVRIEDGIGGVDEVVVNVTVRPINDAPTLDPIGGRTVLEDAPAQKIALTGIDSGAANESDTLTITATSDNPALIPNPAVGYASPNGTGSITFTPAPNSSGTATITVVVNDGQAANNTVAQSFVVTVTDVLKRVAFTSGPTATPATALVGETITVSATAVSPTSLPVTISYNFGDGTAGADASHVYAAPGTYTVSVLASDGQNLDATATVTVVISAGATPDGEDDDGFDTFIEKVFKTDPNDIASRPLNLPIPSDATGLEISRLKIRTSDRRPKSNALWATGSIPVPAGFNVTGRILIISVGKAVRSFSLSQQGRSLQGQIDTVRFSKPRNGRVSFALKLSRGTFQSIEKENGQVRVVVIFNNERHEVLAPAK